MYMPKILKTAPIIGLIRYSQKITFGSETRDVFEPKYFEYRFKIFTEVTLKSFQQQSDSNFALLILHSETMPAKYKEKFLQLENDNQFLYNIFVEDNVESFNQAIKNSVNYISFTDDAALTFRIDNDDAVQKNFIENLRNFIKKEFIGFTINIPNVFIVKRISNENYIVEERNYPSNSIGLAYVTGENYKTILEVAQHHLINDNNALILLPRNKSSVLMTINGENEINSINDPETSTFTEKRLEEFLKENKYDNFNLKCLKILNDKKRKSMKDIINLFTPPILKVLAFEIRTIIIAKK